MNALLTYRPVELFCSLCLVFYALYLIPVAPAQEIDARVEARPVEEDGDVIIEADDDVLIEEREVIYIDDPDAEEEQDVDMDDPSPEWREFGQEGQDRGDRERQQRERPRQRQGGRLPPGAREIMEKENISPEDMRNPEIRKKVLEKAKQMRMETERSPQPDEDFVEKPEAESGKEGLERYMAAIVKKNLFRPLGSGDEKRRTTFALTAVISGTEDRAIIEQQDGGKSFYVGEGDIFADKIEVVDIEEQVVRLDRSGEEEELRLGEGTQSGDRGGGRRGGGDRRNGRSSDARGESAGGQSEGEDFDPGEIPPFALRILKERGISIEELRNNPELRNRLRNEFEARFRSGGDNSPQPVMIMQDGRQVNIRRRRSDR